MKHFISKEFWISVGKVVRESLNVYSKEEVDTKFDGINKILDTINGVSK